MSLDKRAKQEEYKEYKEQQPVISLSLRYICTSKFNISGFIHRNSIEVYAVWCSCAYQNLHCIGETKTNNLAWSTSWQSVSCSLYATAWLENSCWERTAWITSWVGRVLQPNTLSSVWIWAASPIFPASQACNYLTWTRNIQKLFYYWDSTIGLNEHRWYILPRLQLKDRTCLAKDKV